ncbi:MAG: Gfo/Idh/MocA family oxidoreductase [Caldilineaceae bacterium]
MNKQNQIRVGLIGCGQHGVSLAQAIRQSSCLKLVACADPNQEAASVVAKLPDEVAIYSNMQEIVYDGVVDAVILATPPHLLYETALAAIHAGKHVFAEKPIGIDEKEAIQLEEAVARAGVCYMSGYSFRYCAALQQIHSLLQAGAVGEIVAVVGSIGVGSMSSGWHASPVTGGGPMLYVGSHLVDEVLWFVNHKAVEVSAKVHYRADTKADETATFTIHFANGVSAQCLVTQAGDGFVNNLDIHGRRGRISLRGVDYLNYAIEVVSKTLPAYTEPTYIHPRIWGDPKLAMLVPELEEFAAAIHEQRQPAITVSDGRQVLRVLDAVVKSDRSGERVRMG